MNSTSGRSYECPTQQAGIIYLGGYIARLPDAALLEMALQGVLLSLQGPVTPLRGTLKFAARRVQRPLTLGTAP